jgi:hypothetical protein
VSLGVASDAATCWSQATPVRRGGPTRRPWSMVAEGPEVTKSTQGDSQTDMRLYVAVLKSQVAGRAKWVCERDQNDTVSVPFLFLFFFN